MIDEETKELRKRILDLLYKAYDEQSDATRSINNRVSFLAATISLLFSAIITIFKVIIDAKIEILVSSICFSIISVILLLALVLCLGVSFLKSCIGFPIDELIEPAENIPNFNAFYEEENDLLRRICNDTKKLNEKRSRYLNFSVKLIMLSIGLLFISGLIIFVVHYS